MSKRDQLLYELHLADQDGNDGVVAEIESELAAFDSQASLSELDPTLETPANQKERSSTAYILDQMSKRFGDWGDTLVRASVGGALDPRVMQSMPEEAQAAIREKASTNRSAEIAQQYLGYEGLKPRSDTEKYLGVAGAAAVDPLTWAPVGVPFATGKVLYNTTKPYFMAAVEWGTGVMAETAGFAGAEFAGEAFKGTDQEGSVADHLTRVAASLVAGTAPTVAFPLRPIQSAVEGWGAGRNTVQGSADMLSDLVSNQAVRAVLNDAVESQGSNFKAQIEAATKLHETFPDLVLPLVDVVGDNAILAKEFQKLYKTSPEFKSQYDEASKAVLAQFDAYRAEIFPDGLSPGQQIRSPILAEAARKKKQAETKLQNIENARSQLAARYDSAPLAANVEIAARKVAESADAAARENASSFYRAAFDYAETNNLSVPPNVVQGIYEFSKAQRKSDLFADFPSLYRKINQFWSPEKVQGTGLLNAKGQLIKPKETLEFKRVSMEELDSLKQELGLAQRKTSDPTKKAALEDLKKELDRQIQNIDPEFAKLYKNADKQYYEGVGLPTSLQGYRSVDSARFSTTVAEALTKPDQIRDYLNFVGRDVGVEVVRDALLMKARRKIMDSNGDINPEKLKAFLAQNKDSFEQVPELRSMFEQDAMLADRINRGRAKIESNYNAYSLEQADGFFRAISRNNLSEVGSIVLKDPEKRLEYLDQINALRPDSRKLAITGLRQSVLDKAFSSNGTVVDYITQNKAAFDDLFGPEYSQQVENLASLRDMIATNERNLAGAAVNHRQNTKYKKVTGLSLEETIGTLRNQIMTPTRKFLHLFFKAAMTKTSEKADKAMADVLLDTNGLAALSAEADRLRAVMGEGGNGKLAGKAFWDMMTTFSTTLGGYVALGGARGVSGSTMDDNEIVMEESLLPTQEEDEWLFAPKKQEGYSPANEQRDIEKLMRMNGSIQ